MNNVHQLAIKRCHPLEDGEADPACCHGANLHAFNIVRPLDAVGNVPSTVDDVGVRWDKVANQAQDLHAYVLGNRDAVAESDLGNGKVSVDGFVKVDVVRANPSLRIDES